MVTHPLLFLYTEWLSRGPSFPLMSHLCRYWAYTYNIKKVAYYAVNESATELVNVAMAPEADHALALDIRPHMNTHKEFYTLAGSDAVSGYDQYIGVYAENKLYGVYAFSGKQLKFSSAQAFEFNTGAIQWHFKKWVQAVEPWSFAKHSVERWMAVTAKGPIWLNDTLASWFNVKDIKIEDGWPAWVNEDAIVRNAMFWQQMKSRASWSGLISGQHGASWWFIQAVTPDLYLVRINSYEELTTNLLAQSHWQRHDPLTTLPRDMQMQWSWEGNDDVPWTLCCISMDDFYKLNTVYGAESVDKGLLAISLVLRDNLPVDWTLWRGRAGQFFAMGPTTNSEWLLPCLRVSTPGNSFQEVLCSIGIGTDISYSHVKKLTEEALSLAVAKGGNQIVYNSYRKRIRCVSSLQESIASIEFGTDLHISYEPIYFNKKLKSFRANTIWQHRVWGAIEAEDFLPHCNSEFLESYVHWFTKQIQIKASEWKLLGLDTIDVVLPLYDNIWDNDVVQSILIKIWPTRKTIIDVHLKLEMNLKNILGNLSEFHVYLPSWKKAAIGLCLHVDNLADFDILKLLQINPALVSMNWPLQESQVESPLAIVASILNTNGIDTMAYQYDSSALPDFFHGVCRRKKYKG